MWPEQYRGLTGIYGQWGGRMTGPEIFFSLMNKREEKEEEEEEREEVTRGRDKVIDKPIISRRPGQKG